VKIHLADGTIKSFIIDSSSTVLEVSNNLSDKLLMRPDSQQNGFTVMEVFNNIGTTIAIFENFTRKARAMVWFITAKNRGTYSTFKFLLCKILTSFMTERDLSPEDKVADSLAKFENLQVAMKEQKMTVTAKLVFKKRLFLSRELDNQMERELVFHQTVSDLLMGVLPCAEEEVVALAALKLQVYPHPPSF
jgi:hypothetical protein